MSTGDSRDDPRDGQAATDEVAARLSEARMPLDDAIARLRARLSDEGRDDAGR